MQAPQARALKFGVTGKPALRSACLSRADRTYATDPGGGNTSLAGRLTILNQATNPAQVGTNGTGAQSQFRSEHALATAGIIAAS